MCARSFAAPGGRRAPRRERHERAREILERAGVGAPQVVDHEDALDPARVAPEGEPHLAHGHELVAAGPRAVAGIGGHQDPPAGQLREAEAPPPAPWNGCAVTFAGGSSSSP